MQTNMYVFYQLHLIEEAGIIASLYNEMDDPDAFSAGFVECAQQRYVLLCTVSPWGYRDGWLLRRTGDVAQVFCNDDYELRLQHLLRLHGGQFERLLPAPPAPGEDLLRAVLAQCEQEARLISVITEKETYTGFVRQLDDLRVTLRLLDFFGREAEPFSIALRDVWMVSIDSGEERMYGELLADQLRLVEGSAPGAEGDTKTTRE